MGNNPVQLNILIYIIIFYLLATAQLLSTGYMYARQIEALREDS